MKRVYNFSAGPSMLPMEVLERASAELLSYGDTGMSVMEMSHRTPEFEAIMKGAESALRELMEIPDITFCPHGRPVAMEMKKRNIDHQFERC